MARDYPVLEGDGERGGTHLSWVDGRMKGGTHPSCIDGRESRDELTCPELSSGRVDLGGFPAGHTPHTPVTLCHWALHRERELRT